MIDIVKAALELEVAQDAERHEVAASAVIVGKGTEAPYLLARVEAVHASGCYTTRFWKRDPHHDCNCGGHALFQAWLAKQPRERRW